MPTTQRYVNVYLPAFTGLRSDNYRSHDGGQTLRRWEQLLDVAERLKFDGVRVDAEFFRYAPHPEPQVRPYQRYEKIAPLAERVGRRRLKLLVVLGYNPWRNSWSQWAGFSGTDQDIADWYNKRGDPGGYEAWKEKYWPNERRLPRTLWAATRRGYQAMIDDLVEEWQGSRRRIEDLSFSWWQEPDGAGGHDHRTNIQAGWDAAFDAFSDAMLTGDGALDFHEVKCWSPAFTSGWRTTGANIRSVATSRAAYWRRFYGLAINAYRLDIADQPARFAELLADRARRDAGSFSASAAFYGNRPVAVHEFGVTPRDVGRPDSDAEMGRILARAEKALIALGQFESISVFSMNDDRPYPLNESYGFATALPSTQWYERLRGYAAEWGVRGFEVAPEGSYRR